MAKPTDDYPWATDPGATVDPGPLREATGFRAGKKPPAKWFNFLFNGAHQWFQYIGNAHNEPEFLNKNYPWTGTHAFAADALFGDNVAIGDNLTVGGHVTATTYVQAGSYVQAASYVVSPAAQHVRYWAAADGTGGVTAAGWTAHTDFVSVNHTGAGTDIWFMHLNGKIPAGAALERLSLFFTRTTGAGTYTFALFSSNLSGGDQQIHASAAIPTGANVELPIDLTPSINFASQARLWWLSASASSASNMSLHSFGVRSSISTWFPA